MNIKIFGISFCLVIVTNCLFCEARSIYTVKPYDYLLSKRGGMSRRGFLKSFCAKRCNAGNGGNVCRCNGFHFAGKRTSNIPSAPGHRIVGEEPNDIVYKLIENNKNVLLDPNRYILLDGTLPEEGIMRKLETIMPEMLAG